MRDSAAIDKAAVWSCPMRPGVGEGVEPRAGACACWIRTTKTRPVARPIPAALKAMLRASDGILDLLPIATFICDARGTILQYNHRAAEIWGRTPQARADPRCNSPKTANYFDARRHAGRALDDGRGAGQRRGGARRRAHRRARGRQPRHRLDQYRSAARRQRRGGRRGQLLPRHHRAQAHGRRAGEFAPVRARAGAAPGGDLRARRHRHFRDRARRQLPARQRGDLRHHRLQPRANCCRAGCFAHTHPDDTEPDRAGVPQAGGRRAGILFGREALRAQGRPRHLDVGALLAGARRRRPICSIWCAWCRTSPSARRPSSASGC